jgi:hypothetical protein
MEVWKPRPPSWLPFPACLSGPSQPATRSSSVDLRWPDTLATALPEQSHTHSHRVGFAQFKAFSQDAADNKIFPKPRWPCPVLAVGGEKSFGPMQAAIMRHVATNVPEAVVAGSGHWLMDFHVPAIAKIPAPALPPPCQPTPTRCPFFHAETQRRRKKSADEEWGVRSSAHICWGFRYLLAGKTVRKTAAVESLSLRQKSFRAGINPSCQVPRKSTSPRPQ